MKKNKISISQLKKLMMFKPTLKDCAAFFECSEDTISRAIQENLGMSFFDFRDMYLGLTRIKLRQKAIQMGLAGDKTMLIFSLKNLAGWKDNPELNLELEDCSLEFIDTEDVA